MPETFWNNRRNDQTSTEKGSLELLYLCPFPQPPEFILWPLGGPKRQNHPKILRKTVANEGVRWLLGKNFMAAFGGW